MFGTKNKKSLEVEKIERYEKKGFFVAYGKMAHKRFGFLVNNRLKLFEELHVPLRKADIPLNLGAYVSAMIMSTFLVGFIAFVSSVLLVPLIFGPFVNSIISPNTEPDLVFNVTLILIITILIIILL